LFVRVIRFSGNETVGALIVLVSLECDVLYLDGGRRCAVYPVSKLLSALEFHVCIFRWY